MHFKISSAICFKLDQSKMLSSGNELNGLILKSLACLKCIVWFKLNKMPSKLRKHNRKRRQCCFRIVSNSFVIKTSALTSINHRKGCQKVNSLTLRYTVKLLLSEQLRDLYYIYFNNTLLSIKSYVVGTHLNRLIEAIQMSTNNIGLS